MHARIVTVAVFSVGYGKRQCDGYAVNSSLISSPDGDLDWTSAHSGSSFSLTLT